MILDEQAIFSDKQKIKVNSVSTNILDLGATGTPRGSKIALKRDLGKGNKIPLLLQVTESFVGVSSLTLELQASSDKNFATFKVLYMQKLNPAELFAGARWSLPVIPYGEAQRYLRLSYTVAGTGSAGAITAGITMGNDETHPY